MLGGIHESEQVASVIPVQPVQNRDQNFKRGVSRTHAHACE